MSPAPSDVADRVSALETGHARLEEKFAIVAALSAQLTALSGQLSALQIDLAAFKGKAAGGVAVVAFIVPAAVSAVVTLALHGLSR